MVAHLNYTDTDGKKGLLALFPSVRGDGFICYLIDWGLASPALW